METTTETTLKIEKNSFRELLTCELAQRQAKNPSYSLRAFARSIGVNHSTLSQIIRGKRPLTKRNIQKICIGLGYSEQLTKEIMVNNLPAVIEQSLINENFSIQAYSFLSSTVIRSMLEAKKLNGFSSELKWLSENLGLNEKKMKKAFCVFNGIKDSLFINSVTSDSIKKCAVLMEESMVLKAKKQYRISLFKKVIDQIEKGKDGQELMADIIALTPYEWKQIKYHIEKIKSITRLAQNSHDKKDGLYEIAFSIDRLGPSSPTL